jgi:hypothetical protein
MLKRQAAEGIEQQKRTMTAAIYSNANYGKDDIIKAVEGLETHYKQAMESLYPSPEAVRLQEQRRSAEPDWTNPFWAGAARSYARQREALARMRGNGDPQVTVEEIADLEDRRRQRYESYDQTAPKK